MLDHLFLSVKNTDASIAFYEQTLAALGIHHVLDYDGAQGPAGHQDLNGFGRNSRVFFWLRQGEADSRAVHIGFVANSAQEVDACYAAALAHGGADNGQPGVRLHNDPRYYAANFFDLDGYSIEIAYKSWQHAKEPV